MSFENKVVIVTGASSGIGAAAAEMFSAARARVVLVGRNEAKLSAVAARCSSPLVLRADVADDDDARRIVDETIKKFGQIDVLVNNAGISKLTESILDKATMEAYDTIMDINVRSVVHLTNLTAPYLVKTKGNIVNISSVAGFLPPSGPGITSYYVSKAALNHFNTCAAAELGPQGVRVNAISPGPVRTDFYANSEASITSDDLSPTTILNRVSDPEEVADMVLYLASDKALGVTGSNFIMDNGYFVKRS